MSHGHILDGIRHFFRSPSSEVIAFWPDDTYILDTDSGKIRVKDTGGNKPTLVMVPDGPCVIEHFESLINELLPHFRVICFDMPGLGYSYPKLSYDFGLEKSTKIIISVLDALNLERAILSFSCSNGYTAIAVAKNFPERVSRLVLAQTPSLHEMKKQWVNRNVPKSIQIPYIGQTINAIMSKKMASIWYDMALPRNSPHKEEFINHSISALHSGGCFCLASIVQGMRDVSNNELSDIEVPTTMVWGNKDWSHKNTKFESLREHVPNCEIHEFDGCGHFPYLEQPRAFAALLRETQ
jgi:pimeloyl-ACP methyl ester carboxylesterase